MNIDSINNTGETSAPTFSYEFFPPRKAETQRRFWRTVGCLETVQPNFFSVTYGALGSDSEASIEVVKDLLAESDTPVAAHLTCIGLSESQIDTHLERLETLGIRHIVALRGDIVPGKLDTHPQGLKYAEDLVKKISAYGSFDISVAAYPEVHPQAENPAADLDNLKRKFDAGASRALTQFFYDTDNFLRFRDQAVAAGIDQPIIPGLLPVHNIDKVNAFAGRCGAIVPTPLLSLFEKLKNDPVAHRKHSVIQCAEMCQTLIAEGVSDFHFYTLNQSDLAYEVTRVLRNEIDAPEIGRRGLAA